MKTSKFIITAALVILPPIAAYGQTPPEPHISGEVYGHEYADLGLPSKTLWATCNVGAERQGDIGYYFAWGETEQKDIYTWETYKFFDRYEKDQYGNTYAACVGTDDDICGTEHDAARVHWGGTWRMPHYSEIKELRRQCWWLLTTEDGVLGYRIYGPNENSIFMPFTNGYRIGGGYEFPNDGLYWSGSVQRFDDDAENNNQNAYNFYFDTGGMGVLYGQRFVGCVIRPVIKRSETGIVNIEAKSDACVIYKNGIITILSETNNVKSIEAWSINGSKILSIVNPPKSIDATGINPGIYVVRLKSGEHILKTQKIIIN